MTAKADPEHESIFLRRRNADCQLKFLGQAKTIIIPSAAIIFTYKPIDPITQSPPNFQILVAQRTSRQRRHGLVVVTISNCFTLGASCTCIAVECRFRGEQLAKVFTSWVLVSELGTVNDRAEKSK